MKLSKASACRALKLVTSAADLTELGNQNAPQPTTAMPGEQLIILARRMTAVATVAASEHAGDGQGRRACSVCFGSLADVRAWIRHVRFTLKSGHAQSRYQCLQSANSGHLQSPKHKSCKTYLQTGVLRS